MSVIIEKLLYNIGKSSYLNIEYIEKSLSKNGDIYSTISSLPNITILLYSFICLSIYVIFRNITITLTHIMVVIVSYSVIYYLINKNKIEMDKYLDKSNEKIEFLHNIMFSTNEIYEGIPREDIIHDVNDKISYLYLNQTYVDFFYNVRNYINYNANAYQKCLLNINRIICIYENMKLCKVQNDASQYFGIAEIICSDTINTFHSIIYSIPTHNININFEESMMSLQLLLENTILDMRHILTKLFNNTELTYKSEPSYNTNEQPSSNHMNTIAYSSNFNFFT
jgi:hypothetical protein